jgi:hypothetical protein
MAVGDMKYKFVDNNGEQQEIVVSGEELRAGKRAGKTNRQVLMEKAYSAGYAVDKPEETPKKTTGRGRAHKPNETKADLINRLSDAMQKVGDVNVINPERQLQVVIDGVTFEFTLVQKRAAKK